MRQELIVSLVYGTLAYIGFVILELSSEGQHLQCLQDDPCIETLTCKLHTAIYTKPAPPDPCSFGAQFSHIMNRRAWRYYCPSNE